MLLHTALFHSFLWLGSIPLYICTTSLSIHLSMNTQRFLKKLKAELPYDPEIPLLAYTLLLLLLLSHFSRIQLCAIP